MKKITLLFFYSVFTCFSINLYAQQRLTINGKQILYNNQPIYLKGVNFLAETSKLNENDADTVKAMGMNFVRLLIDVDTKLDLNDTEGDGDYVFQSALDDWSTVASWFASRQIWMNIEFRSNIYDVATSDFWVPGSPLHTKWVEIWKSLVLTLKGYDYIAAWGLLAEHAQSNRTVMKNSFLPIMQAIDAIDGNTPFTFGPKLNGIEFYDISQYNDVYWPAYANRIIYQINHLHPKPYINKDPLKGYDPATWWYHRTDGQDGAGSDNDDAMHKAGTVTHLLPGLNWRDHYNAPIYIDQWGCDFTQPGYLDYERDMLEIFKEQGDIPNTRWTYHMSGARGIMNDVFNLGVWQVHKPLFDFFESANIGNLIWPHEVAVSDYNAADNNITTDATETSLPWNIDYKFSAPFSCNKIELWNGNTTSADDPATVKVLGSNDSINWTNLTTISGITFSGRLVQYVSPRFNNSIKYKYYRARITANNGGSNTIITNLEFFPGPSGINTSIEEIQNQQSNFVIYPNPTSETLVVNSKSLVNEKGTIQIINMLGEVLKSNNYKKTSEDIKIDVSELQPGIYFIKIDDKSTKFIKG